MVDNNMIKPAWCFAVNDYGNWPVVYMADGSEKFLDDVKVGDQLVTLDEGLKITTTTVKEILTHSSWDYEKLAFNHTDLICTSEHPFWITDGWIEARNLKENDKCLKVSSGPKFEYIPVLKHDHIEGGIEKEFINLTCYPFNTFFIDGLYVHNCN